MIAIVRGSTAGSIALGALLALPAHAAEDAGDIRMHPNRMLLPTLGVEGMVTAPLLSEGDALLHVGLDWRGVPLDRPGWSWLPVHASVALAPDRLTTDPDPPAFALRVAAQRRAGESHPVAAASDLWLLGLAWRRDRPVGIERDLSVGLVDWSGGLYLPSMFPRDLDARILVAARALGARHRVYTDGRPDFLGAAVGGLGGEFVYGRRLTPGLVLTGHLGGSADWSVGAADEFEVLTDTAVWVGGMLDLGEHHVVDLRLETTTNDDSDHLPIAAPRLALAWRGAW